MSKPKAVTQQLSIIAGISTATIEHFFFSHNDAYNKAVLGFVGHSKNGSDLILQENNITQNGLSENDVNSSRYLISAKNARAILKHNTIYNNFNPTDYSTLSNLIYFANSSLDMQYNRIYKNGYMKDMFNFTNTNYEISNNIIVQNDAKRTGGATFFVENTSGKLRFNTIVDNESTYSFQQEGSSSALIENNIFAHSNIAIQKRMYGLLLGCCL